MARLITRGKDHGIHAFLVQIRSLDDHSVMPGEYSLLIYYDLLCNFIGLSGYPCANPNLTATELYMWKERSSSKSVKTNLKPEVEGTLGGHVQSPYMHGQVNLLDRAAKGTENVVPERFQIPLSQF